MLQLTAAASNSPLSSDRANCTNCHLPDVTTVIRVFLNGQDKGITPAKIPFDFYGTWDLQIRMEENELRGSRSLKPIREKVRLDRPWHQMFPFDLFTEILYPGTLQVEHVLEYTFEPQDLDALRDAFDEAARQEGVQPPLENKSATGSGDRR